MSDKEEFPPLLEPGFHIMTLADLRSRCVGSFPLSKTRARIMDGLEKLVDLLRTQAIVGDLWIDGSFVTQKLDPADVDIVLCVHSALYENGTTAQQNLLDLLIVADMKPDYFCDAYLLMQYSEDDALHGRGEWLRAYWIKQFGFSRGVDMKGMALIQLR